MLVLGTPMPGMDAAGHNAWMAAQLAADPESAINMMVTPDMTPEYVAAQVDEYGFLGLKPYRTFAPDPVGARICDFLPESLIEVAHHKKLAITMHLAKPTGPADPDNQRDLARYTREYPNAQWILAHCARSFNSFMMEEAVHFLCDLPNIWYDTSAVNDLYAHYLLMKHEDRKRVMFGSDNVVRRLWARQVHHLWPRLAVLSWRTRPARRTAIRGPRSSSTSNCAKSGKWPRCCN